MDATMQRDIDRIVTLVVDRDWPTQQDQCPAWLDRLGLEGATMITAEDAMADPAMRTSGTGWSEAEIQLSADRPWSVQWHRVYDDPADLARAWSQFVDTVTGRLQAEPEKTPDSAYWKSAEYDVESYVFGLLRSGERPAHYIRVARAEVAHAVEAVIRQQSLADTERRGREHRRVGSVVNITVAVRVDPEANAAIVEFQPVDASHDVRVITNRKGHAIGTISFSPAGELSQLELLDVRAQLPEQYKSVTRDVS